MAFYSSIAENYGYIFPYNPSQFTFISQNIKTLEIKRMLEIGSATGLLTSACFSGGYPIEGLELDEEMVQIASDNHPEIVFKQGNMLDIDSIYGTDIFDVLICFGNTIVHLSDIGEIEIFLAKAYQLLTNKGKLLVQFINYDRILDKQISALPTIENEHITFDREYENLSDTGLDFNTRLSIHASGKVINNSQSLFPLRKNDFIEMAERIGFTLSISGSFNGDPWSQDAMQSIFVCEK